VKGGAGGDLWARGGPIGLHGVARKLKVQGY